MTKSNRTSVRYDTFDSNKAANLLRASITLLDPKDIDDAVAIAAIRIILNEREMLLTKLAIYEPDAEVSKN